MTRVLVVDDDPAMQATIARLLELRGMQAQACYRGADALRPGALDEIDLIILDLGLPDISGSEICRELRRRGAQQGIIIVTGRGEEGLKNWLLVVAGADDYIVKPFHAGDLAARVHSVLRRSSGRAESYDRPIPVGTFETGDIEPQNGGRTISGLRPIASTAPDSTQPPDAAAEEDPIATMRNRKASASPPTEAGPLVVIATADDRERAVLQAYAETFRRASIGCSTMAELLEAVTQPSVRLVVLRPLEGAAEHTGPMQCQQIRDSRYAHAILYLAASSDRSERAQALDCTATAVLGVDATADEKLNNIDSLLDLLNGSYKRWLRYGVISVDLTLGDVHALDQRIPLSASSYRLLVAMLERLGSVMTQNDIQELFGCSPDPRAVRKYVEKLRVELARHSHIAAASIETRRDRGYGIGLPPEVGDRSTPRSGEFDANSETPDSNVPKQSDLKKRA